MVYGITILKEISLLILRVWKRGGGGKNKKTKNKNLRKPGFNFFFFFVSPILYSHFPRPPSFPYSPQLTKTPNSSFSILPLFVRPPFPPHTSHPQTKFPTRSPGPDPIHLGVKLGYGGDGGDAVTAQLRELLAIARVDVHEAIHVADAEPLHAVGGMALPVRAKTAKKRKKGGEGG